MVTITENGVPREVPFNEAKIRRTVDDARKGILKSLEAAFEYFLKHDAIDLPVPPRPGGVLRVPPGTPMEVACIVIEQLGQPDWSDSALDNARAEQELRRHLEDPANAR